MSKEDAVTKFEPFSYVNEENIKRLAYLLRREEPWLIAVVLSYLKPELARELLGLQPQELQNTVGLESATIRQASRGQIAPIDADLMERVDFVLGGVEQLCEILEDAADDARRNILEFLKNERPSIYEKVRESILMFEDLIGLQNTEIQSVITAIGQVTGSAVAGQFCSNYTASFSLTGGIEIQLWVFKVPIPSVTLYKHNESYKEPGCS